MNFDRSIGLALKSSRFNAPSKTKMGFILSDNEMKRLAELRDAMASTSKAVNSSGRFVAAGLGAVALGLTFNALGKRHK